MAQNTVTKEALTCSICLKLLKEPVTIPCGHSFCRSCVQSHWDQEERKSEYSCPECRESFRPRPVLVRNIMLVSLVEQMKETGLTKDPVGDSEAGSGDVPCDMCSGRKMKAVQSCLQCLVSYCERHLQPHREVAVLQKHQLVPPSYNLQEYLCSEHNEVKKMFCRFDQQLLCMVCCLGKHKGHDTVSSAMERAQKQNQLENRKQNLLKTICDSQTGLKRLQEEAQAIRRTAQDTVQRSGDYFSQMILLLEKRRSVVEQQIRDQEMSELRRVQELQDQVQLDITQRKKILSEIDKLLKTPDHNYFLQLYSNLPTLRSTTSVCTVPSNELHYFDSVTKALSTLRKKIQLSLTQSEAEVSTALRELHTLLSCRQGFLKYACDITLDSTTAHKNMWLSEGNRRVTYKTKEQSYPHHPDRFSAYNQVLSKEALTGRCYWEVEMGGTNGVCLAVAYRDIVKAPCCFGYNDRSWALHWHSAGYSYVFNNVTSQVPGPFGSRLAVFLDHSAGLLSFYSIKDKSLILIHRVQAKFTQPLHVGVWVYHDEHTVCFPQLKNH